MPRTILANEISKLLPVKPGMLLLDRVQILDENHAIGLKCLTMNESVFAGHFPGRSIMPGVLQIEALAQLAELTVGNRLDPLREADVYVKSLSKFRFRRPNTPGDRMFLEVCVAKFADGEAELDCVVRNNSGVTCEGRMILAVRKIATEIHGPMALNEFDKSNEIALNTEQVMALLPHRYPFLFVDYITKLKSGHITGIKNITSSESILREYANGYEVLTGSSQAEIIAQVSCVHLLSTIENPNGKLAYFTGIEQANFYRPVLPGDQLRIEADLPTTIHRFGRGGGSVFVDGHLVSELHMSFVMV